MRGTRRGENAYKRGRFSIKCMIAGAHTKINELLGELRGGRGGGEGGPCAWDGAEDVQKQIVTTAKECHGGRLRLLRCR